MLVGASGAILRDVLASSGLGGIIRCLQEYSNDSRMDGCWHGRRMENADPLVNKFEYRSSLVVAYAVLRNNNNKHPRHLSSKERYPSK